MKPEQVESLTIETSADQLRLGRQSLPRKVLRPTPRYPQILIAILFILLRSIFLGALFMVAGTATPYSPYSNKDFALCPEQTLFSINTPFGNFSYTVVRLIDAAWNLVVGRVLQAFVTWVCYMGLLQNIRHGFTSNHTAVASLHRAL